MRILIVEDEPPIADYIERCTRSLLNDRIRRIDVVHTLDEADFILRKRRVDLCLLDLNLSGTDGYDLLKTAMSMPFLSIIISAHIERAVEAFEFGVIDFVPKPFTVERLQKAFDRYLEISAAPVHAKYLAYRLGHENRLLETRDVSYFKATRVFVEAYLHDGRKVLLDKHLNQLEQVLPDRFFRIHRSYIVNLDHIGSYLHTGASRYRMVLKDGTVLPVSRFRYRALHRFLNS